MEKNSNKKESINVLENSNNTEVQKFMQIMQTHLNYLIELRQQKSSKLLQEHRSKIMSTTYYQMFSSYLSKCLTWKEYQLLLNEMRDKLSWESITGVKQLSIFDDLELKFE